MSNMNESMFLEEKEKLLKCIELNTKEHWEEYYKDVPIECIYDDLVIDINEIKRLQGKLDKIYEIIEQGYYEINSGCSVVLHIKSRDKLYDDIQKIIRGDDDE